MWESRRSARSRIEHETQRLGGQVSRRDILRVLAGASLMQAIPIFGSLGSLGSSGCSGGETGSSGSDAGTSGSSDMSSSPSGWASGGTAAMTAKASYPDPFTSALTTCALVASTTEGPCTTASDLVRQDISEGWTGLPVRLALQVVDSACKPLAGVTVKVWHTNREGSYSGQTPNNGMCLKQQTYSSQDFFRGVQTTDASGKVFFDGCFPGWYRGRAVHIHFQVKNGATSYRVSQLFFPEDITADIFATHGEYTSYGQPDTVFSNDNIMAGIPSAQRDRHILTIAQMSDGAMLASKVVTVT